VLIDDRDDEDKDIDILYKKAKWVLLWSLA